VSPLHSLIRREEGQALAEFALVLPLLVLVLFSMIHFGKAFNYWNTATHITAEGARYAAVNSKPFPADVTSLQGQLLAQAHTDELRNGGPGADAVKTPATVCIDFPSGAATRGAPVRVTMTFTYSWLPLIGGALGTGSSTITSSSIMRLETAPTTLVAGCA
jgi:Flp pilus assembly protein TadG